MVLFPIEKRRCSTVRRIASALYAFTQRALTLSHFAAMHPHFSLTLTILSPNPIRKCEPAELSVVSFRVKWSAIFPFHVPARCYWVTCFRRRSYEKKKCTELERRTRIHPRALAFDRITLFGIIQKSHIENTRCLPRVSIFHLSSTSACSINNY